MINVKSPIIAWFNKPGFKTSRDFVAIFCITHLETLWFGQTSIIKCLISLNHTVSKLIFQAL